MLLSCILILFISLIINSINANSLPKIKSALSDNPFQGNEVVYLSGAGAESWIAWTSGPVVERKCNFIDNVDFDTSSVTGKTTVKQNGPVTSKESCCIACYETVECAASVFNIETSECWLKNQTQLRKRMPHLRAGFSVARPPCLPLCGLNTAGELQLALRRVEPRAR